MLDALLGSEELPEEFRNRNQVQHFSFYVCNTLGSTFFDNVYYYLSDNQDILCNDCERKGTAPFHWLYHKCATCGSYNTKVIKLAETEIS